MNHPRIYFRRLHSLVAMAVLIMSVFVACDVLEDDISPDNPTVEVNGKQVYALTGNAAYIDLRSMVKTTESIRLAITSQPSHGKLNDLKQGLLQYTPFSSFTKGRDGFQFSVYSADNKLLLQDTVVIIIEDDTTNLPCGIYPANDYIYGAIAAPITFPVLNNDILCADSTNIKLEIYRPAANFPPFQGTAEVVDNQFIRYTPKAGFTGADSVIYKVSSTRDTTKVGYGLLVIASQVVTPPPIPECQWTLKNDLFTITRSIEQDTVFLPIFENDTLCSNLLSKYVVSIVKAPRHGAIQLNGLNPPRYGITLPDTTSVPKTDTLVYQLCAGNACKNATTIIKINP